MRAAGRAVLLLLAAGAALLPVLLPGAAARAQVHAYGMAARVNGVGISNEELERSFQEYLRENNVNIGSVRNPDRAKAMRRETLDLLIDRELAWQAARKENSVATEAEVDGAVAAMRAKFKSDQAFATRLAVEGYTAEGYREHIRRVVTAEKYLERFAASAPKVGDGEIHAFYAANPDKFTVTEGGAQRTVSEEEAREQIRSYLNGIREREAVQAELKRLQSAGKVEVLVPL